MKRNGNMNGKKMIVKASAYTSSPKEGGALTYTGHKCKWGVIAVDKNVIPLYTKVYIPQFDMVFVALDTGSAIRGNKIDIWMPTRKQALEWGIKTIDIVVLG